MITLTTFLKNCLVNIFLFGFFSMSSFSANEYNVIPCPRQLISQSGLFAFNSRTVVILHILALCVILPPKMKVHDSTYGTDKKLLAENQIPHSDSPTWEMIRRGVTYPSTEVRFIILQLTNGDNRPYDHPDKMDGSMIFMDEICLK